MGSNSKEESFRAKFEVENAGGRSSVSSDLLSILRKLSVLGDAFWFGRVEHLPAHLKNWTYFGKHDKDQ